jgi:hypothetical protein
MSRLSEEGKGKTKDREAIVKGKDGADRMSRVYGWVDKARENEGKLTE